LQTNKIKRGCKKILRFYVIGFKTAWLMLFNVEKCQVMPVGYKNMKISYEMEGRKLDEMTGERDFGVICNRIQNGG
jgi:hypothetical protein